MSYGPAQRQRMATTAIAALIVVATVIAYLPAMRGEFLWDDNRYVRDNLELRTPQGLWNIWFDPLATPQYHPLVFTSYWIEYHLWAVNPLGYHIDNMVLHAANALLLWGVCAELGVPGGALAAAIFALHPVHLASVAWITERKNTLSALFCLATMWAWVRYVDRRRRRLYVLALAGCAATLLSKSVLCMLPVALLLLAWWKRPADWERTIGAVLPFVVMSAAMAVMGRWREQLYKTPGLPLSLWERVLNVNHALWFYVGKLFWPHPLMPLYPRWDWQPTPLAYGALGLTVAVCLLLWSMRERLGRGPLVGAAFFVIMLLPVLGVVDFNYTQYSFVADHFQYVPSLGLIAVVAAAVTSLARGGSSGQRTLGWAMAGVGLLILGGLSWRAAANYAKAETFWTDALAKNPQAWEAESSLAGVLAKTGDINAAIPHYAAALRLKPDYAEAENHWGVLLSIQDKRTEALQHFDAALRINPAQADAHNNAGAVLAQQGKWDEAAERFAAATRINPQYFEAYDSWGIVALRQGKVDEAIAHFETALQIKPDFTPSQQHLERARNGPPTKKPAP